MLTSLLPGLRELRAPLAAGYIWLLAGWIAFESRVADRDDATEVLRSLYRLDDALSGVGLFAAATFVAYLVGSLSTTLFSRLLRRLFRASWFVNSELSAIEPLTDNAVRSLRQLARESRERMEISLALTDKRVSDVLDARRHAERPRS
jgi:hypothetical protein